MTNVSSSYLNTTGNVITKEERNLIFCKMWLVLTVLKFKHNPQKAFLTVSELHNKKVTHS